MRTDYAGHDRSYRHKRNDPDYADWMKQQEFPEKSAATPAGKILKREMRKTHKELFAK